MWFLPLLIIGVAALVVGNRERGQPRQLPVTANCFADAQALALLFGELTGGARAAAILDARRLFGDVLVQQALVRESAQTPSSPAVSGPIRVLGEFVRLGQTPPPPVILCAIAEAESTGHCSLASDIIRVFVAPVVQQHERSRAPGPTRGSARELPVPSGPPAQAWQPEADRPAGIMPSSVQERVYAPRFNRGRGSYGAKSLRDDSAPQAVPQQHAPAISDIHEAINDIRRELVTEPELWHGAEPNEIRDTIDEVQRELDADPEGFRQRSVEALRSDPQWAAEPANDLITESETAMLNQIAHAIGEPPLTPQAVATIDAVAYGLAKILNGTPINEVGPEAARILSTPVDDLKAEADAHRQNASMNAPPIAGVPNDAWAHFCGLLAREAPGFQSSRHVGQYRQRRERLAELGIDPGSLVGSADAQNSALYADLADAYRQATDEGFGESGLVQANVHRKIAVPHHDEPIEITLSGVLGVVQAAGLEGAVGWFKKTRDRKEYPHTTQAFIRCNGVF